MCIVVGYKFIVIVKLEIIDKSLFKVYLYIYLESLKPGGIIA